MQWNGEMFSFNTTDLKMGAKIASYFYYIFLLDWSRKTNKQKRIYYE